MIEAPFITLTEGANLTKAYRDRVLPILSALPLSLIPVNGFSFSKDDITTVLSQSGAKGLKIYLGLKQTGLTAQLQLVVVAQDITGDDILVNEVLLDHAIICPPSCGDSNSLNS